MSLESLLERLQSEADAEQAAITREADDDLREYFEEKRGILEHDAGLPHAEAELEAARLTSAYATNQGCRWAGLREALAGFPALRSQVPDRPGSVDVLVFGLATVHVREGARVVRQGVFEGHSDIRAGQPGAVGAVKG